MEKHPLRDSCSLPGCGHHLPQSRHLDRMHLRSPDDGAVPGGNRGGVVGASRAQEAEGGGEAVRIPSSKNWVPHPRGVLVFAARVGVSCLIIALAILAPFAAQAQHFDGAKAYEYAREFAAIGPRWPTGPGHVKAEEFLRAHFLHDQREEDTFTADTPIGPVPLRNFIVRYQGTKPG